jgi:2-alkyl-3-oxoalkanoate reductase
VNAPPGVASSVRTYLQVEQRVLGPSDPAGVALRYGFFYGPGTYHDPQSGSISQQVREQRYRVIGLGKGVFSFVHVEDAASATVAVLEGGPANSSGLANSRVPAKRPGIESAVSALDSAAPFANPRSRWRNSKMCSLCRAVARSDDKSKYNFVKEHRT